MKKIRMLALALIVLLMSNGIHLPVLAAGTATVQVTIKTSEGTPLVNQEVTCTDDPPDVSGELPTPPSYNYITTNSLGVATWTVSVEVDHMYQCYARSALTQPDQCYYLNTPTPPGEYSLNDGEVKNISITGTYAASTCQTASSSSSSQSSSQSSSSSESASSSLETSSITLPGVFIKDGSNTTDISSMTTDELAAVSNFTLDNKNVGKVQFLGTIDLSAEETQDYLNNLDDYVEINIGSIDVDSQSLPVFDVSAEVTLYNLDLIEDKIKILRNGEDSESYVSNVLYDEQENTLMFEVSGFSSYKVASNLELDESTTQDKETSEDKIKISGSVGDLGSEISVYVNDEVAREAIAVKNDGTFEYELKLEEKNNEIEVIAKASSGVEEKVNFNVVYTAGEDKPDGDNFWWILLYSFIGLSIILAILGYVGYRKGWFKRWFKKKEKTDVPVAQETAGRIFN